MSAARGSVVIAAHDEEVRLPGTLAGLAALAASGELEVVVVANGCHDATAAVARAVPGVVVVELAQASKIAALNAGDATATAFPRIYLDADIDLSAEAARDVCTALTEPSAVAARPPATYDTAGATWPVRAFHRTRQRLFGEGVQVWGAGVYALSEAGRGSFGPFPDVVADDLFVDRQFTDAQKRLVETLPVVVRVPRDTRSLLTVLTRTRRGNAQVVAAGHSSSTTSTAQALARSVRGPASMLDAGTYVVLILLARFHARRGPATWGRDESTRQVCSADPDQR